ncbi:hypothetical protein ACFX13_036385 [Malus domestica]
MAVTMAKVLWVAKAANRNYIKSGASQLIVIRLMASASHSYTTVTPYHMQGTDMAKKDEEEKQDLNWPCKAFCPKENKKIFARDMFYSCEQVGIEICRIPPMIMAANMAKILWFKAANRNHVNSSISQLTTRFLASVPHNYTRSFLGPVSTELKLPRYERMMVANFKSQAATAKPKNIDNPCLDLFYNVVKPSFSTEKKAEAEATCRELKRLLPLAWSHNPLTAVKLIWNLLQHKILMDVDGEAYHVGKAYREAFYAAACWLHQHHPKTLASNITPTFTLSFGCFSDTVRILYLLLEGQDLELSHLKSDIENLKQSDTNDGGCRTSISEAALSCNSDCELYAQAYSTTKTTKMRESIAKKFFPRAECQGDAAEADYVDMVLQRLTDEVLMPLDNAFYDPRNDPPVEEEEDRSRVVHKYLEEVKSGKTKIVADALLPHEIIRNIHHWNVGEVAELQWIAMVEDFKKQGKMNNCLPVCDIINN